MTSTARLVDELRAVGLIGVAAEAVTYPEPVVPVETVRAAPAPVAPSADDKLVELLAVANTLRKASEALVNAAALCEQLATRAAPVAKAAEVVLGALGSCCVMMDAASGFCRRSATSVAKKAIAAIHAAVSARRYGASATVTGQFCVALRASA